MCCEGMAKNVGMDFDTSFSSDFFEHCLYCSGFQRFMWPSESNKESITWIRTGIPILFEKFQSSFRQNGPMIPVILWISYMNLHGRHVNICWSKLTDLTDSETWWIGKSDDCFVSDICGSINQLFDIILGSNLGQCPVPLHSGNYIKVPGNVKNVSVEENKSCINGVTTPGGDTIVSLFYDVFSCIIKSKFA